MDPSKKRIKDLMAMRDGIESEVNERMARLDTPGAPGLTGPLLDTEGFPRADIDIRAVREDRHRVAMLKNDHKAMSEQIFEALQELHAHARDAMEIDSKPRTATAAVDKGNYPFAYVDSVSPDSPATDAGIEVGDQLCQFGSVIGHPIGNDGALAKLGAALKIHEGKSVETVFLRNGDIRKLQLTPKKWGGPGLIGCHLRPI